MKVVFLEEVEGTARTGDVKNVADGFARNYLLPRKLAAPATDHYINIAQAKAGKESRRQEKADEEARERVLPKVDGKSVEIEVRVGEQGKLFGSVTARDIAEALQAATRVELEHRQVDLKEPIRELGAHEVTVKVTRNVLATVTVNVVPVGGFPAEEAPEPASAGTASQVEVEGEDSAPYEEMIEEEIVEEEPPAEAGGEEEPAEQETESESLEQ
jgi:large subunit ribosomal protein L9